MSSEHWHKSQGWQDLNPSWLGEKHKLYLCAKQSPRRCVALMTPKRAPQTQIRGILFSKFSLTSLGFSFFPSPPCFFLLFLKLCRKERKRVNGAFCISDGNLRFLNGGKISGGRIEKEFLHFFCHKNLEVTFCPVLSSSFNQFLLFDLWRSYLNCNF